MLTINIQTVNLAIVRTKLARAAPRILAHNRLMVGAILEEAKPIVAAATPLGPAHFGYHGRDTLKVKVTSKGVKSTGVLTGAIQMKWREKGTKRGERAFKTAHKAVALTKRMIKFWYGGMAAWYKYP